MTFHVGQKVVCVDCSPTASCDKRNLPGGYYKPNWPQKGETYTIRAIEDGLVLLEEVRNPIRDFRDGPGEGSWYTWRFRPIVERKTDISIFTAMLNPSKRGVDA